jgi:NADPH:quinone reductase-like Zn-dependent oxidoreductase
MDQKQKEPSMKYKHVVLTRTGNPDALQLREDEIAEPGRGEVLVKILAAGVAYADIMMRHGKYPGTPALPFTPGYDMVGIVEQTGERVQGIVAGQKVAALTRFGSYSQYICLAEQELVPVPEQVDPAEGVCLILNYLTAYQMLHRLAHVQKGEHILVHGAAGGVGTALLHLGKLANLELYGTASSSKQTLIAEMGALPIDYTKEDFVQRIRVLTGNGVDAVFDPVGGPYIRRSFQALRKGGRLVAYGLSSGLQPGQNFYLTALEQAFYMLYRWIVPTRRKILIYSSAGPGSSKKRHSDWFREDLTQLFNLLAEKKIKPVIAERLPLEEVRRAHELLEQRRVQGKLVLLPASL